MENTFSLYYTAPDDGIFQEVKAATILVRLQGENFQYQFDHAKIKRYLDLENVSDNLMFMFASLDQFHQIKLMSLIGDEARKAIIDRLIAGGDEKAKYRYGK